VNALDDFLTALKWRSAVKNFDVNRALEPEILSQLLDAARLAPSSYGLQPWKFVVVHDALLRQKLRQHAWDQAQITEAACIVVLCSLRQVDRQHIESYLAKIVDTRAVTIDSLKGFSEMMNSSVNKLSPEANRNWSTHQVYIALGMLLSACAVSRVDACPMEGFDRAAFDRILGLEDLGLASCVLCALGYRKGGKDTETQKKVRFDADRVVIWR